jgi:membrane-bound lytic murein transglycosylase B
MQNDKKSITQEKKRHTRKHTTGSTRKKQIILLSKAKAGKVHDKKQLDENDWVSNIPDAIVIEGDLGYQGLQKEFVNVRLPHKKPKGQELTEAQKQENREFSSQRVKCEHAHAGMKRYNPHSARNGRGQTIKKQAQGGDSSAGKQEKRNLKCEDEEPTN